MSLDWWKKTVFYQIYPKSFYDSNNDGIVDINGIIEKINYIKELGVGGIWISPVYLSPQIDNGYDISDYRLIDPMFGTNEDMYRLIEVAHKSGIKIVMDFVANHTSDKCIWFQESVRDPNGYFGDFYIWKDANLDGSPPNNWGSNFGGSAWTWNEKRNQYYLHYYAEEQPDLNWENPLVRSSIYDMMRFWKFKGIDGWRMDVITSISKNQNFDNNEKDLSTENQQNGPRMHEFIHEINTEVLKPFDMMSVGESPSSKSIDAHLLVDPKREELDMIFTFEHMHVDRIKNHKNGRWAIKEMDLVELKKILSEWQNALYNRGWNALYFENHDMARVISRWGNDAEYRYESATAFATILHGLQGTPFVYQGEEIGMTNPEFKIDDYKDIELLGNYEQYVLKNKTISEEEFLSAARKISRDNARTPMQWNSKLNAGFSKSKPWIKVNNNYIKVNVENDRMQTKSVFEFYKKLILLRKTETILIEGEYKLLLPLDNEIFLYTREFETKKWYILANLSIKNLSIPDCLLEKKLKIILNNYRRGETIGNNLEPYESIIFEEKII